VSGNNKLKLALSDKADAAARRTLLREAVQFYTSALETKAANDGLNSIILSNRAHAHALLGMCLGFVSCRALTRTQAAAHADVPASRATQATTERRSMTVWQPSLSTLRMSRCGWHATHPHQTT
jgi:hypothetical protein